jgi:hypothetical protein
MAHSFAVFDTSITTGDTGDTPCYALERDPLDAAALPARKKMRNGAEKNHSDFTDVRFDPSIFDMDPDFGMDVESYIAVSTYAYERRSS